MKLQELNIQHPEEVTLMSNVFECQKELKELTVDFQHVCSDENKLAFARSKYDVRVLRPASPVPRLNIPDSGRETPQIPHRVEL